MDHTICPECLNPHCSWWMTTWCDFDRAALSVAGSEAWRYSPKMVEDLKRLSRESRRNDPPPAPGP